MTDEEKRIFSLEQLKDSGLSLEKKLEAANKIVNFINCGLQDDSVPVKEDNSKNDTQLLTE